MESGSLTEPLWDASTISYPYPNNGIFVREYTIKLLCGSFPNISASEVNHIVIGTNYATNQTTGTKPVTLSVIGDKVCKRFVRVKSRALHIQEPHKGLPCTI